MDGPRDLLGHCCLRFVSTDAQSVRLIQLSLNGQTLRYCVSNLVSTDAQSAGSLQLSLNEQTFAEADQAGDGVISRLEFHSLVEAMPGVIDWMTLPILRELTTKYPSFLLSSSLEQ